MNTNQLQNSWKSSDNVFIVLIYKHYIVHVLVSIIILVPNLIFLCQEQYNP